MAWFSNYLILIGAALFGYIFSDLLLKIGWKEKQAYSIGVLLGLGVLAFISYWLQPFFMYARFQTIALKGFYSSDYFKFTVALMVGNAIKLIERLVLKKQKPILF